MKRITFPLLSPVLLVLVALLFAGCAGAPEPAGDMGPVEEPEKKVETAKAPVRITETIYLVEEEISYYGDGMVDERRVNRYKDDAPELIDSILYDAEDEVEEKSSYRYENGLLTEEVSQNKAGEILSIHRYSYSDGNRVEDLLLNSTEEVQTRLVWDYDDAGRMVRWEIHNGNGALLAYTEYVYKNGRLDRIENYNSSGELEEIFTHEYRGDLLVKMSELDKRENLVAYTIYRYEAERLVEETLHRKSGAVRRRTLFENGDHGMPVNSIYLDMAGNVLEKRGRSYISRTVTRTLEE